MRLFGLFFSLLFLQKAPVHPGVQRKQAPLETLHIGSGQLSLHGLSQLLPKTSRWTHPYNNKG